MSSPTVAQKLTAEAIGTAILVFIGAGSVPLTVFLTAGRGTGSPAAPACPRSRSRSRSRSSPRSTRSATSAAATSTRP